MFLMQTVIFIDKKIILWDEAKDCGSREFDINLCDNSEKKEEMK